jgi:hypothetical protein
LIFNTIDISQINSNRIFPRLVIINVTYSMRGQIGVASLVVGDLVFPSGVVSLVSYVIAAVWEKTNERPKQLV